MNQPHKAILNGFSRAEQIFLEQDVNNKYELERSGSCAIVLLIIESRCYVGNLGDSRAIMSGDNGQKIYTLSRDHKPSDEAEYKRIIEAGGKIYQ